MSSDYTFTMLTYPGFLKCLFAANNDVSHFLDFLFNDQVICLRFRTNIDVYPYILYNSFYVYKQLQMPNVCDWSVV